MSTQIQSQDLEGWVVAPGNYKYYGTDGVGAEWFQDLDTAVSALWYTQSVQAWAWPTYEKYWVLENISSGQYVSKVPLTFSQPLFGSTFFSSWSYSSGSPYTLNQWQALSLANNVSLKDISVRWLNGESGSSGVTWYDITAKIYAASWTPGSGAVPTWAALYTSALISSSIAADGDVSLTFTFDGPLFLVAWNYCISFEGTITRSSWTGDAFDPYGTWAIAWRNGYNLWVANNSVNFYYNITTYDYGAYLADANDANKLVFAWVALETKVIDEVITVQNSGVYPLLGINAWEPYYVTDTAGTVSNTPGTNQVLAGIWAEDDYINLIGEIWFTIVAWDDNDYTNTSWSNFKPSVSSTPVEFFNIIAPRSGTYRISFDIYADVWKPASSFWLVYRNWVAYSAATSDSPSGWWDPTRATYDLYFDAWDSIEIWWYSNNNWDVSIDAAIIQYNIVAVYNEKMPIINDWTSV